MSLAPGPETGLQFLNAEMARQFPDAAQTYEAQAAQGAEMAAAIRLGGRPHLLGNGSSRWVNTLAAPYYRTGGIDAMASGEAA